MIVVLVGVAIGSLFGYKGGVIMFNGKDYGFSNNLTQYDDFAPGSLFDPSVMEPFSFSITDFDVEWITDGPRAGMARKFVAHLDYETEPGAETQQYDLKVNHPLSVGGTDVFLIGHGYAPVITIRDGDGNIAQSGPAVFLPTNAQTFESFGVVKAPDAQPDQIGLEGTFYPTFAMGRDADGNLTHARPPPSATRSTRWSRCNVYTGDVGLDDGTGASVYVLDKTKATQLTKANGQPFRMDLRPGDTVTLPDGLGSVTFEGLQRWNKIQISRTPGKLIALTGVVSPCWACSARCSCGRAGCGSAPGVRTTARTLVEVARLDRSSGGDPETGRDELAEIVAALKKDSERPECRDRRTVGDPEQPGRGGRRGGLLPRAAGVRRAVGRAARRAGPAGGRPPAAGPIDDVPDEQVSERTEMAGRLGVLLTGIGALAHFVALLGRGLAADPNRVPWGNMYEFTLSGTFVVVALFLATTRRWRLSWLGPIVVGFVLCVLLADVLWLYEPVAPLTEALESYWLVIHVVSAVIATGAFTLGGITSILYLLKARSTKEKGYLARLPELADARPDRLPDARLRVPGVDLRGADLRPDLGAPGVVVVLELGPQGGVGLHHLGGLRRLPPRPRDGGLARPQRRAAGPGRCRDAVVQLHRHQLLQHDEPALLRRGRGGREVSRPQACGAGRGPAGSPGRRRGRSRADVTTRRSAVEAPQRQPDQHPHDDRDRGDDQQDLQHSSNVVRVRLGWTP